MKPEGQHVVQGEPELPRCRQLRPEGALKPAMRVYSQYENCGLMVVLITTALPVTYSTKPVTAPNPWPPPLPISSGTYGSPKPLPPLAGSVLQESAP